MKSDFFIYDWRARYYDPSSGRFLSEDPIGFLGGDYNLYRYVRNNPVLKNDPSGKWPEFIDDGVCSITGRCDPTDIDSKEWWDTLGDTFEEAIDDWFGDDKKDEKSGSKSKSNLTCSI
ncbi:MAG: RHS repeat-associated core domain-containing protein [Bacteriovoracaceae bacterium]|nr:RHS repeat-associated core domain-containing protein [Bacteriovoracaceae bacterium]